MRVLLAILMLAAVPFASGMNLEPQLPENNPTSFGQAIIGFVAMPDVQPGDNLGGLPVVKIEPRGNYVVVLAETLGEVRAAASILPGVAYIEDDQILTTLVAPNDSRYNDQYGPAQMGAHAAWDAVGYGSSAITVAVLDTGIRASHEDLAANYIGGYDYVNNDGNPNDDCGHGTHVSGTVAAVTNNGKGVAGVSQASIIHHKVLGPVGGLITVTCSGSSSDINEAIYDAADADVHIISMSLGGGGFSSSGNNAVNYAYNSGVLVVAAAGNDGQCSNCVGYPAAYDNAIAVGSLTNTKARSGFSSSGPQVEIAAGGSNVWSTYNSNDASYSSLSGTSMATPHVAGALALALSCDPSISNVELRSLMQSTAEDLGPNGRDVDFGFGLLRVDSIINAMGGCGGTPPVNDPPVASFSNSCNQLACSFTSTSSDPEGDALSYSWAFGDGGSSSQANPSHNYASAGTYTVSLSVSDGEFSDQASATVTVSTTPPPPPTGCTDNGDGVPVLEDGEATSIAVGNKEFSHRKICVPEDATSTSFVMSGPGCGFPTCSFDADMHVRAGAKPTTSTYDCRPYNTGNSETCTSSATGWIYVSPYGYTGSGTVTITADHNGQGAPPPNGAPTAAFAKTCTDLACDFDASGSTDPDGDALSFSWDFGDGNNGAGQSPSHSYGVDGTYTVTLTVSDGNGGSDQATQAVSVSAPAPNQPPAASFSSSCNELVCSFSSTSSDPDGDPLSYAWSFGDGASASSANPSHSYSADGTYTVTLTVDDGNGGSDQSSAQVSVAATPPPPSGCSGGDASVSEMNDGQAYSQSVAAGQWKYGKICAQAGDTLSVAMTGPSCSVFSCSLDADLYVKGGAKPTSSSYDCRPYTQGNAESCTISVASTGWYYVGVYGYSGSGSVTVTAST